MCGSNRIRKIPLLCKHDFYSLVFCCVQSPALWKEGVGLTSQALTTGKCSFMGQLYKISREAFDYTNTVCSNWFIFTVISEAVCNACSQVWVPTCCCLIPLDSRWTVFILALRHTAGREVPLIKHQLSLFANRQMPLGGWKQKKAK